MKSNLKVKLVQYTPNPEQVVATAAKLCYANPDSIEDLMEKQTPETTEKFLNMLTSIGHASPVEHVNFTFAIEGVSRALTHQLVRHRIASYSQQSQRYVKLDQFEYIIPPAIENDDFLKREFIKQMCSAQNTYDTIVGKLKAKYIIDSKMEPKVAEKKAIEDARYVFPNACESKIIVTMNARSLYNFFKHRCCDRAQWEIKDMAWKMWLEAMLVAPNLFKKSGPGCSNGKCPEGTMTCGKKITTTYEDNTSISSKGIEKDITIKATQGDVILIEHHNKLSISAGEYSESSKQTTI